jgi:hypothetical protein
MPEVETLLAELLMSSLETELDWYTLVLVLVPKED